MMTNGMVSNGDRNKPANPLLWVAITTEGMPEATPEEKEAKKKVVAEMDKMTAEMNAISNSALTEALREVATFEFGQPGWRDMSEADKILQWKNPKAFEVTEWEVWIPPWT